MIFKVVGGAWDDGKTEDKTVTLTGFEGDTLKLAADQIPAVGGKPAEGYKEGAWDVTPVADTAIDKDTTYCLETDDGSTLAVLYVTMTANTDKNAEIIGESGRIHVTDVNNYRMIELYDEEGELVETAEAEGPYYEGYAIEVLACSDAISKGLVQAPEMPWSKTARVATINDIVRSMSNTSMVNTNPAMGALKIPDTAPAAPHPTSSIIVRASTRKRRPRFEPMAEPVSTIGASAPTDPPKPMVMELATTDEYMLCGRMRACLREIA